MERQILFRGSAINNDGQFVFGQYYFDHYNLQAYVIDADGYKYDVYSDSVGQFTGVIDKSGNKVFEGDIVGAVMDSCDGKNCEITFYDGCFCARYSDYYRPLNRTLFVPWNVIDDFKYDFVVKGDIHHNPELLNA